MMKRAIITGATGFVGANLARRLLSDGQEVHLLVRPSHSSWRIDSIRRQVQLHEVALEDSEALTQTVARIRPDWIFHLAAHGAYPSQTDLRRMIQTNLTGTINLVEACLKTGFEAFVNTGSSSEYGFKDHAPSEDEALEPNSHYGVTKASATLFCRYTAESRALHLPTLRLYSVYGPYEEPTRLVPRLITHGFRNELPPLVNPSIARDYVYVDDVTEAYILAAKRAGQQPHGAVYNVGTGIQTSLAEAVETARRVLLVECEPRWATMPERAWDTSTWVADNRRIKEALGWRPTYTFEQGFRRTVEWLRASPALRSFYDERGLA
ncbi:MAG TPA: SDR family NAD(P)-dependent oxidoreductase [Pyrinomonadaceae bacterium]|jgi:nucleoside-diphosphate-sugar epimerase